MKKNWKTFFVTGFFLLLTLLLLTFPKESLAYSFTGLQLWFNRMIPTLLPFMILSAMMIRLNLTGQFVRALSPFLCPIFSIGPNGIYAIIVGFLCGFPMGAKVVADLLVHNKISEEEAEFLLSFCNNIGPIYFISFVLPTLNLTKKMPYLLGMYGIPLFYGVFLRYTIYKNTIGIPRTAHPFIKHKALLLAVEKNKNIPFLDALDDSVMSGLYSIAKLGGYMVLFNLLNLMPQVFMSGEKIARSSLPFFNCLLEITSGISRIGDTAPLIVLLFLPFGGFSCLAQTYSMIKDTGLSLKTYTIHKLILTGLTAMYYGIWQLFSPSSFLL